MLTDWAIKSALRGVWRPLFVSLPRTLPSRFFTTHVTPEMSFLTDDDHLHNKPTEKGFMDRVRSEIEINKKMREAAKQVDQILQQHDRDLHAVSGKFTEASDGSAETPGEVLEMYDNLLKQAENRNEAIRRLVSEFPISDASDGMPEIGDHDASVEFAQRDEMDRNVKAQHLREALRDMSEDSHGFPERLPEVKAFQQAVEANEAAHQRQAEKMGLPRAFGESSDGNPEAIFEDKSPPKPQQQQQ
uniref:Uncharacterized protein n=1 Tax=Chromera velia CCMP2878 TaxID=1169474 RepID=A0A0G4FRR7_9ALVE|eukprot:Cvel_18442.t1-p1 / transcript=Cvel_18442.t1 / gene=Cvel_18442 / organism=Chromera_velia_CCMP2878 / gene_product=hypothetical protein / transcript_product=hypothetical protein / location=Cvel_scaffold1527:42847-43578(-) / protein_length=244 / sequence_SO=supercontig / SO=protein_coding / is_pseudo=false